MQDLLNNRYLILEELGAGGMGAIYRTQDRLTGDILALKRITVSTKQLRFATLSNTQEVRLALAQEFRTLASLRHPNIISVLDYGFDSARQPFFTMELLEGAQNILQAATVRPMSERLDLLVQLLRALVYLHRRGIIHRDLKPDNVLVVDGVVRVLDFGLAVAHDEQQDEDSDVIAGTLAYMAPELLQGDAVSKASDLYAVGVMAYEMFAGRHPFDVENPNLLVMNILGATPDFKLLEVEPPITEVVKRLLDKQPEARFQEAAEVIRTLAAADARLAAEETPDIRDSFLQAAEFVGRDAEFATLDNALMAAVSGQSAGWLIGGESGVGKSRLLDELRIRALVEGAQVLRGQATSGGGHPYKLWLDIIRTLALTAQPGALEASVLKTAVPDIGTLLGQDIPDAPRLDPAASRTRFMSTVVELIRRQPYPMLMILEDLHWASNESLDLLKLLLRRLEDTRILLIGSFRDDEAPTLPVTLQGMQLLRLNRLQPDDITALSVSMLGENGRQPRIIELLQQETEGNVFFIVETVRALAEEAGQLDKIGLVTLPRHVFSGGIQKLVQRRLNRVSSDSYALLEMAAVAGRQLDLPLLAQVAARASLDSWLAECANAAVLEFHEGGWRFMHDKLREGLLLNLSEDRQRALHGQVAKGIEQVYGDRQAAVLVYHFGEAGDRARQAYYAGIAGEDALRAGSNRDAVNFLNIALAYAPSAERERQLGEAYYGLGVLAESRVHLDRALTLLNQKLPGNLVPALAGQLGRLGMGQVMPKKPSPPAPSPEGEGKTVRTRNGASPGTSSAAKISTVELETALRGAGNKAIELARIYGLLAELSYFTTETLLGMYSALRMLNITEGLPPSAEGAQANVNMCIAASLIPHEGMAEHFGTRAEQIAGSLTERAPLMRVTNVRGVYFTGAGQWERAEAALDIARDLAEALGDRRQAIQARTTRAVTRHYQGKFEEAAELNAEAAVMAENSGNRQQIGWGTVSRGENLNSMGRAAEAREVLDDSLHRLRDTMEKSAFIRLYAAQAKSALLLGEYSAAVKHIEESLAVLGKGAPNVYSMLESYSVMGDVYLTLIELDSSFREQYLAKAETGVKMIKGFARLYPPGKPRSLLWGARLLTLQGKGDKAPALIQQACAAAESLGMPQEAALARAITGTMP